MANPISGVDEAGRKIAGLLTYNPGPGIYSRLERAIEQMPENVRVQELPGLLKRYKEGVPGWELKETDLDSVIAGRDAVPREELLARVQERSPVYTHKEIVLGGTPQDTSGYVRDKLAVGSPSPLGAGGPHGDAVYGGYSQGGKDYTELLVGQPTVAGEYGSHWGRGSAKPAAKQYERNNIIAHARFDTHGDALRINELQSDLGIHNRKAREYAAQNPQTAIVDGQHVVQNDPSAQGLPFPLEDTWADLLIKRLALEAARKGNRAIEVASPRAIADKVGGNIDNYEHFYGKVVPGALERLGRKMGGLSPDDSGAPVARLTEESPQYAYHQTFRDQMQAATGEEQLGPNFWRLYSGMRYDSLPPSQQAITYDRFGGSHPVSQAEGGAPQEMYDYLHGLGLPPEQAQRITSQAMYLAPHNARDMHNLAVREQLESVGRLTRQPVSDNPRRYIMSDEMRRRLIEQGVGASVLAPLLMQEER
jgi:hypothetical protein